MQARTPQSQLQRRHHRRRQRCVHLRASQGGGSRGDAGASPSGGSGPSSSGSKQQPASSKDPDPNKADFSAYWSLKFRQFFSGRRQYLEASGKRPEQPAAIRALNDLIAREEARIEQTRTQGTRLQRREGETDVLIATSLPQPPAAPGQRELQQQQQQQQDGVASDPDRAAFVLVAEDVVAARAVLQSRRVKATLLGVAALRDALRAAVLLPLTLPAALHARWQALFSGPGYEAFLMAEGERIWYWRNRMENERWFWEIFFWDRLLVPVVWTLCYLYVVPNNLLWAFVVPLVLIALQNGGRLPHPASVELWLLLVFGVYGKCWHQVVAAASAVLAWW